MKTSRIFGAILVLSAVLMGGCATTDSHSPSPTLAYGVVDGIEATRGSDGGIGAGTVIGGVVGGVLGHQVGGGTGNDVATVAGVVGGAVVGHQIEKSNRQADSYRVRVRLENGGEQTVTQQSIDDLRIGDRVRIESGRVSRY
ncbi:MAG TPA: glycine zipper 2TM domain-containing protein [Gallionella sp.]|nr:glycine zipper 2TM domain-containing protein [Gallionella sp.]